MAKSRRYDRKPRNATKTGEVKITVHVQGMKPVKRGKK